MSDLFDALIAAKMSGGGGGGGGFSPTTDQLNAMNSGITEAKVANYDHIVTNASSKTYYLQPDQPTNPQDGDIWIG